jgi:hypothetical protein
MILAIRSLWNWRRLTPVTCRNGSTRGGAETLTVPCLWVKLYQLCLKLRNFRNTATRDADVSNKRKFQQVVIAPELFCPFKFVVRHPSRPISFRANPARPGELGLKAASIVSAWQLLLRELAVESYRENSSHTPHSSKRFCEDFSYPPSTCPSFRPQLPY